MQKACSPKPYFCYAPLFIKRTARFNDFMHRYKRPNTPVGTGFVEPSETRLHAIKRIPVKLHGKPCDNAGVLRVAGYNSMGKVNNMHIAIVGHEHI